MDKYERIEDIRREECYTIPLTYRHKETGTVGALRRLKMQLSDDFGIQCMTLRKISLLKEIDHENVVRFFDDIYNMRFGHVHLMLEYLDLDLKSLIKLNPEIATDRRFIRDTLEQILRGLYCYHSINVAHGNLNPTNVLVDCTNLAVKLTDLHTLIIAPSYKAPEILNDPTAEITPASDMFSVGCIFGEMLNQKPLFYAPTGFQEIISISRLTSNFDWFTPEPPKEDRPASEDNIEREKIKQNLENLIPDFIPSGIDLLSRMLCLNPKGRITVEQALKHPYFECGERIDNSN